MGLPFETSSDEDIKVDGVTYRGYAENQNIGVLDIIPEMEHIGNYIDCTDRYLLAITGIDSDLYDTIPYKLIKGIIPPVQMNFLLHRIRYIKERFLRQVM